MQEAACLVCIMYNYLCVAYVYLVIGTKALMFCMIGLCRLVDLT